MKPGRLISPPGTYFATFSTWQRQRLFVVESYARMFLKTMYRHRRESKYRLHAFVLMPEHVHLLLTPAANVTLEHAVQLIKGSFSHEIGGVIGRTREVWQRGFTDHRIRDLADFEAHEEYIHENPVRRRLVTLAAEYRYCSAYPGSGLMRFPQRLKPQSHEGHNRHEWNSCPSRFLWPDCEFRKRGRPAFR